MTPNSFDVVFRICENETTKAASQLAAPNVCANSMRTELRENGILFSWILRRKRKFRLHSHANGSLIGFPLAADRRPAFPFASECRECAVCTHHFPTTTLIIITFISFAAAIALVCSLTMGAGVRFGLVFIGSDTRRNNRRKKKTFQLKISN